MRPRAPISLVRARLISPLIQTLIVLRIEARKWLINGIIGRLVLPYMRQRNAADAMAADRVTYDRVKAIASFRCARSNIASMQSDLHDVRLADMEAQQGLHVGRLVQTVIAEMTANVFAI
jgi:hypothetical protein